jgi:secreted PhoX family phosphatase
MRLTAISIAVAALCPWSVFATCPGNATLSSVEFIGMAAPATADEKADAYTQAKARMTCSDGSTSELPLRYHAIFTTADRVGDAVVGGLLDASGKPLTDRDGQLASDGPDGTSLMQVETLEVPGATGNPLAMVTNFEYRELPPNDGSSTGSFWSRLPPTIGLTLLDQDKSTGLLTPKVYRAIDLSGIHGGWIHCGATLSSWGTHIGSEEYEPDAKVRGGGAKSEGSDDKTDIASFSHWYFGDPAAANAYRYGVVPEVSVSADGTAKAEAHYAPGRFAREMQMLASDDRTSIGGDDGKNTGLFMFVADKPRDLSAGTLYAAKLAQTSADNGGRFDLKWIRLGHATDAEIESLVDKGIRFSDIFEVANTDPNNPSFKKVTTYTGTEWLKLKPGMEQAAAFLETRRYAALLGATTEFSKMEYIAYNKADKRFYVTISRVEAGMADDAGDIRGARNDGGMILEMATAAGQNDSAGNPIDSNFVGVTLSSIPELLGGWMGKDKKDVEGNACTQDRICGPDNLVYADAIRTLFIGEDTGRRNNNYLWAFNIDTRKLSRILSVPMAAEVTGLSMVPDYNGFAYITANFQHPGDEDGMKAYTGNDKAEVAAKIDALWGNRKKAAIGYIGTSDGALPPFK